MPRIVIDIKTKKVACALLQVIYGGDLSVVNNINVEAWELAPTPDFRLFSITTEELKRLVEVTNKRFPMKG